MPKLRDGRYVDDLRLDRLVQFDERSRSFPVTAELTTPIARSYTWRCESWLDQGSEGACTGFSRALWVAARPKAVQVTEDTAKVLYKRAQQIDEWPGEGYSGSSVLAAVKAAQEAGYVENYHWSFSLSELAAGVARFGPAVLGVNWYGGMYRPDAEGVIHVEGAQVGGHAILCNGVSVKRQTFRLHNSWGKNWGKNGECEISWSDMARLLDEDGEACFARQR